MAYIELNQVSKRFGAVTAVDSMNLQIAQGECLAMLGPSGCGKTTTLRMLAGLEAPTVAKVLKPLAQAGLVEGFRGATGGYRLARPATRITLVDIVEALEGPLGMTECSVHAGACGIESSCGVRASTTGATTPVASMSMTTAREPAVFAWSAMPAVRPRRLKLIA